jgi:hypothetical protein
MNTLLEPPSSFFQPAACIGSLLAINDASPFSRSPQFEIPSVGFSALAFPQTHCVTAKAPLSCILSEKNDSALSSRDSLVRANHSAPLTLREIE